MQLKLKADLTQHHTFSITQTCEVLIEAQSIADFIAIYADPRWHLKPKLVLGKGSNMLFTQPYQGVVVLNRIMGKTLTEDDESYYLHVNGGEDWPDLVRWSVEQGIGGLENLALIPGCAGSAPIQNIGAYGVELKDVCHYVDVLFIETGETKRLSMLECQFGYRDSIFKHQLKDKVIIVALGLKLAKKWQAINGYGPLQQLALETLSPKIIFDTVCQVRQEKLPDPNVLGNAGSFFKNPVIKKDQFDLLQKRFPNIVGYPNQADMKVAAGWLIDQCDLKGYQMGGAQVHPQQALVIVNKEQASAQDVIALAQHICDCVRNKFGIELEHEVRFMAAQTETNLQEIMAGEK